VAKRLLASQEERFSMELIVCIGFRFEVQRNAFLRVNPFAFRILRTPVYRMTSVSAVSVGDVAYLGVHFEVCVFHLELAHCSIN
jgi:hypothetical protein